MLASVDTTVRMFTYEYCAQRRHNSIAIGHDQFASHDVAQYTDSYSFHLYIFFILYHRQATHGISIQEAP